MRKMRSGVEIEMFQKNLATKLRWIYQIFEDDVGYKHEEHKQDLKLSQSEEIEYWVNKPSQKRVISPHTYSIRSSTSPDHPRKIPPAGNDHRPPSLLVCSLPNLTGEFVIRRRVRKDICFLSLKPFTIIWAIIFIRLDLIKAQYERIKWCVSWFLCVGPGYSSYEPKIYIVCGLSFFVGLFHWPGWLSTNPDQKL